MEFETLNAMNESISLSLMMMKVIALITVLFAITGFAIYLGGIAWLCFAEMRRRIPATRTPRRASPPNSPMPLVPNAKVGTILSTRHALMCEASPAARARI